MQVLLYNELNPSKIPGFKKLKAYLEADDFKSADVKKIGDNLYRARLDRSNRLLFALHQFNGELYALVLEYIASHAYEKSRFLNRGVTIDEDKIPAIESADQVEAQPLIYLNARQQRFNLLDKIISFDDAQSDVYALQPPLIIIGSAGSGKTALTLEKMKHAIGDVLYVTRSAFLVHNSRDLYYAANYQNEDQQVDFLSFQEYLESIEVPQGREMTFREFDQWFSRHRAASSIKDAHQLFEEFKGVITGPAVDQPYLDRDSYLGLGIKQSIFDDTQRDKVYDLFEKYRRFLHENQYYDANILSHAYLDKVEPRYDFIVMDEVQDLTNIQMQLILKSLRDPSAFILCGDSNQIVHPNFFSWSKIKSYFHQQQDVQPQGELIRILNTNYRNSPQVTEIANRVLKIKNARFGSIDKESNYLVRSNAHNHGEVILLHDRDDIKRELDHKTSQSTRFAVIVMHPEDKARASACFNTPLVFSVQEAKGLEYENIVLFNFCSTDEKRFREITRGVQPEDLQQALSYSRNKDKTDKSLEIFKFHINALYVALTRAIKNIYLVESETKQRLFDLLQLQVSQSLKLEQQRSSMDEWREEAQRLEQQGKQEQAESIRSQILKQKEVPWEVLTGAALEQLKDKALQQNNKKAKLALFEYSLLYHDQRQLNALIKADFGPAKNPQKGWDLLKKKYFISYEAKQPTAILRQTDQYGINFRDQFNHTPLMNASRAGNANLIQVLAERGAKTELVNNAGLNAFQIALEQAIIDPKFAHKNLSAIYRQLEPEEIDIQVDNRLIKLNKRLMEFFMLNLAVARFYRGMTRRNIIDGGAFSSGDIVNAVQDFPDHVLPPRRKKRSYISSILSKNEVDRDDPYNRKLFFRTRHGKYIINPRLSLRIEGEWINIYQLLSFDMIAGDFDIGSMYQGYDINDLLDQELQQMRYRIERYQKTGRWPL